ncbi:hypothetical protein SAMN05421858_2282 [Haladaptatus litoreus]|uniref:Uncharacterized protein n=1 Tax=Haladaptatus litoreus TaxID=553468 RepID=A0A1N7A1X5_9EURY|nr:hypothetical protein [Haladaptatus litoreus]SIR33071.1 hypothetical protein SAMN05421858_2282 [Haladaptatus litoreus]
MARHEATFEIRSKSDAHAINLLMDRVYDSLREQSTTVEGKTKLPNEMLETFDSLRTATNRETPGTLTIVYEEENEPFEE